MAAARDAARRARKHRARGQSHRVRDGGDAAVRLHDQHVALVARLPEPGAEVAQIAPEHGADVRVDHRGAETLVLLDLGEHVGGERDVGVRQEPGEQLARLPLVARIAVGMQVAHRDRGDARARQPADRRLRRRPRERRVHSAVEAEPLGHVEAPGAGHQRHRRRHPQVVAVVLQALAHLDDVAVSRGRQHPHRAPLALEQCIGGDGRPVDDEAGDPEQPGQIGAELGRQEAEAVHDAKRRIGGGRGRLGEAHAARVVHRHQVGEGPADVYPDAIHG